MSVPDFSDYLSYPQTENCYLDGRYFNLVFKDYPGLIQNPLEIDINIDKLNITSSAKLQLTHIDENYPGLLRIIINSNNSRHCNLAIIDWDQKTVKWFNPEDPQKYRKAIYGATLQYLDLFLPGFRIIDLPISIIPETNKACERSGFCVAYCIKYAYDFLLRKQINLSEIKRFANAVEQNFGPLDPALADVEYGPLDSMSQQQAGGLLLGGLGGAALGGLVAGPVGFLAGGAIGGIGGYALGSAKENQ